MVLSNEVFMAKNKEALKWYTVEENKSFYMSTTGLNQKHIAEMLRARVDLNDLLDCGDDDDLNSFKTLDKNSLVQSVEKFVDGYGLDGNQLPITVYKVNVSFTVSVEKVDTYRTQTKMIGENGSTIE